MALTIEPFAWASDLPPDDVRALTGIFNDVWGEWVPGERPVSEACFLDEDRFTAPPEVVIRRLARDDDGAVGYGTVEFREGPGACVARLLVAGDRRQEGIGRALGASLVEAARAAGRSGVTVEAACGSVGDAICRAAGLVPDLEVEQNRTATASIDLALLERWRRAGEAAEGYELVTFDSPCPDDDLVAAYAEARHVMNDAPRYEGEPEHIYTAVGLRASEAATAAAHIDVWNVAVRHQATGELVGLSDLYLPRNRPWMAFQGDTGVRPDHRGHGLGAWMKAVNHLRLAATRPDVETVQTWNAAANEPMLRINRALGFAPVQRFRAWFLSFD